MSPKAGVRDSPSNESEDGVVALVVAACFAAAYAGFSFYDDGTVSRTAAPVVSAVGECRGVRPGAPRGCGDVRDHLCAARAPEAPDDLFAALSASLTAVGWVVGFVVLFFIGVAG